jgi:DNA-binding winged helix-turn-helix (wHTH) protein
VAPQSEWFCTLLDSASDVYFRYALTAPRGFAYISPSVRTLTGRSVAEFQADRNLCLSLVAERDRRLLRRVLRTRRPTTMTIRMLRHGMEIPVELRTVALVRRGRLVAIEGVARLALSASSSRLPAGDATAANVEPVQQQLAALMAQVHELLHQVLPPAERAPGKSSAPVLRCGALTLDTERLTVTESGRGVNTLTPREVQVLRYFLTRVGRVVSRTQLLTDVWALTYTGDDRTVDVHIARLRRKLPSLRGRLVAIRNMGYRLEEENELEMRMAQ